jgi:hypothetical protein
MKFLEKIIITGIVLVVTIITVFLSLQGESDEMYREKIIIKRQETDQFMMYSSNSPFRNVGKFHALSYYPPNPEYRVSAKFILIEEKVTAPIAMSDGSTESYIRYAWAEFELGGNNYKLLVLKNQNEWVTNQYFVSFTDTTSGDTTYAGGRYLNVFLIEENEITLDFNLAYNPYCVYDFSYICPIAPPENKLSMAIEAGEKLYIHDDS